MPIQCASAPCVKLFQPHRSCGQSQKYCSKRCRQRACNRRQEAKRTPEAKAFIIRQTGEYYQRTKGDRRSAKRLRCGITVQDKRTMLSLQPACLLCAYVFRGEGDAHADHNHKTGRVRGLLCRSCNMALGLIHDNVETAYKMAKYLQQDQGCAA